MRRRMMTMAIGAVLAGGLLAGCTSSSDGPTAAPAAPTDSTSATAGLAPASTPSASSKAPSSAAAPVTSKSASAAPGPAGGPVPAKFVPTSTTFVSPDTGWVLGTAPCSKAPCTSIVRTRDGGQSWTGIPAPKASLGQADSGRNGDVSVLRFADETDGWAGVGKLYSTHNGGAAWNPQQIGHSGSVVSALETGGGYVYALTSNCPSQGSSSCSQTSDLYASPIGRDDWTQVGSTIPTLTDSTSLIVTGNAWFVATNVGIYHGTSTQSAGRSTNPCPADEGERAAPSLAAADSGHLDALCVSDGGAGSAQYQLYGTSNGGQDWQKNGGKHLEASGLFGIADNGQGVLLAATASGGSYILRTTDDGKSFPKASIGAPTGGYSWADLGFTTTTQAVVVLPGHGLYLSHDAGRSFDEVSF